MPADTRQRHLVTRDEIENDLSISATTSVTKQTSALNDTLGMMTCEATEMSREQFAETMMDSAAGCHVNMTEDLSVTRLSEMSAGQLTGLSESTFSTRQQTELNEMTRERLDLEQQLGAELQAKDAECRQLRDTIAELERQVAEQTRLLDESRDHEDDLQRAVEASQAELRQSDGRWHEVVETKEQLARELRADLDALTGSVQRREHMWDVARRSMEEQMETMRLGLAQQTAQYDTQVQVSFLISC